MRLIAVLGVVLVLVIGAGSNKKVQAQEVQSNDSPKLQKDWIPYGVELSKVDGVSIKRSLLFTRSSMMSGGIPTDEIEGTKCKLADVLGAAYMYRLPILGEELLPTCKFDVVAYSSGMDEPVWPIVKQAVEQAFGVSVLYQEEEVDVYFLRLDTGSDIRPKESEPESKHATNVSAKDNLLVIGLVNWDMDEIVRYVGEDFVKAYVINETGLEGKYDLDIEVAMFDGGSPEEIDRSMRKSGLMLVKGKARKNILRIVEADTSGKADRQVPAEDQDVSVYFLRLVGDSGAKPKKAGPDPEFIMSSKAGGRGIIYTFLKNDIADIANHIERHLTKTSVLDETGLKGEYELTIDVPFPTTVEDVDRSLRESGLMLVKGKAHKKVLRIVEADTSGKVDRQALAVDQTQNQPASYTIADGQELSKVKRVSIKRSPQNLDRSSVSSTWGAGRSPYKIKAFNSKLEDVIGAALDYRRPVLGKELLPSHNFNVVARSAGEGKPVWPRVKQAIEQAFDVDIIYAEEEVPVYYLRLDHDSEIRPKQSAPDTKTTQYMGEGSDNIYIFEGQDMAGIANYMENHLLNTFMVDPVCFVVDETGLEGKYDLKLEASFPATEEEVVNSLRESGLMLVKGKKRMKVVRISKPGSK